MPPRWINPLTFLAALILPGLWMPAWVLAEPPSAPTPAAPPDDMFIGLEVPAHQVYLGECMKVEYDVYVASHRGQIFYEVKEPDFKDFYSIEGRAPEASFVSIEGKPYTKEPFAVFLVTPNMPGRIQLPPIEVQVPFREGRPWITHAPRTIEVIPPPSPMPEGFKYGNVGQFEIKAELGTGPYKTGDVVSVMVELTGNAPAAHAGIRPYRPTTTPEAFRPYPIIQESTEEQVIHNTLRTKIRYRQRLLALQAGTWTIDPFEFVYFDPRQHQYHTARTQPINIQVTPGPSPAKTPTPRPMARELEQAMPIPIGQPATAQDDPPSLAWMAVAPAILLITVLVGTVYRRRKRGSHDNA